MIFSSFSNHCQCASKTLFGKKRRELSMQRFWATDGNRKCAVFVFNFSSHYHINVVKSLFTSTYDQFENLRETTFLVCEMFTSGCRTSQCKILIVSDEGWFGQLKYSTPKKKFYLVSSSASIFSKTLHAFKLPGMQRTLLVHSCRAGEVVRAHVSHRCGPGSILSTDHMWAKFVVGSFSAPRGFLPGTPVSPLLKNQHF